MHHGKYSFPDGSLNCQVSSPLYQPDIPFLRLNALFLPFYKAEDTLFSIHGHIRELSPALADLFPVDRPLTTDRAHSLGIHPSPIIKLHGVKASGFEAFLDMIYTP